MRISSVILLVIIISSLARAGDSVNSAEILRSIPGYVIQDNGFSSGTVALRKGDVYPVLEESFSDVTMDVYGKRVKVQKSDTRVFETAAAPTTHADSSKVPQNILEQAITPMEFAQIDPPTTGQYIIKGFSHIESDKKTGKHWVVFLDSSIAYVWAPIRPDQIKELEKSNGLPISVVLTSDPKIGRGNNPKQKDIRLVLGPIHN